MDSSNKLYHERKESDLWLLIQYERSQNVYDIIHSSDVIQKDKMHIGNIIDVRSGSSVLKASILIISDDRHFLEKKMRNLTRMPASLNLTKGSETVEQRKPIYTYTRKRKMTKSPTKYKPNATITRSMPSPTWSSHTNESTNISAAIPPMTFDQGTQTDNKLSAMDSETVQSKNLSTFMKQLECVMIESQQTRQMVNDLLSLTYDTNITMKEMQRKSENNDPHIINSPMNSNTEQIVFLTESSSQSVTLSNAHIDNNVTIVTHGINNDNSNISCSNASRLSIASNELICNISNIEANQSSASDSLNNTQSSNYIKRNWNEFQIDEGLSDDVTIGSNGTKVPRIIMDSINWSSHCMATCTILSALFTTEVLATHSLTGKVYKSSMKPSKNQLNDLIVSDIVQLVSKICGVPDTAVRNAISTKCFNEEMKLCRLMEKERTILQSMANGSKENDLEVAHNLTI